MISSLNGTIIIDGRMLTPREAANYALTIIDTEPARSRAIADACRAAERQTEEIRGRFFKRHGRELMAHDSGRDERNA